MSVGGRDLLVKVGAGVLDEADGLRLIAHTAGATPVPEVLWVEPDLLVEGWIDQGARTAGHEEVLGRMLASLHAAPYPEWGGGSSWIGDCRVDPSVAGDAADFYGARLFELGTRCGWERPLATLAGRIGEILPPGGPALVHGDLWWGNLLWGTDGRPWLIDPSVHGGHPEEDLAMLGLFGPIPDRTLSAYTEIRQLDSGWEDRTALFQLYPLLVHTLLFGGGYRSRAEAILHRLL